MFLKQLSLLYDSNTRHSHFHNSKGNERCTKFFYFFFDDTFHFYFQIKPKIGYHAESKQETEHEKGIRIEKSLNNKMSQVFKERKLSEYTDIVNFQYFFSWTERLQNEEKTIQNNNFSIVRFHFPDVLKRSEGPLGTFTAATVRRLISPLLHIR